MVHNVTKATHNGNKPMDMIRQLTNGVERLHVTDCHRRSSFLTKQTFLRGAGGGAGGNANDALFRGGGGGGGNGNDAVFGGCADDADADALSPG